MATQNRNQNPLRRVLAFGFGTVNLAGETITNPRGWMRGIERRGHKVMDQLENNNRNVRRSLTLVRTRTSSAVDSLGSSARATVGLASAVAGDVERTATPRRSSGSSRTTGTARRTTRRTAASATGTRGTTTHKARSQAAQKAARTRKLNATKAEAKHQLSLNKARATRAANASKSNFEKTADRVQDRVEKIGDRIGDAVSSLAG